MSWQKIKLKELLIQQKNFFEIKEQEEYMQITVSNRGEIKLRGTKKGLQIGTKKQITAREGWFIYSRLGLHNGAFGIIPKGLDGAIVTGDMPLFKIDSQRILPNFLLYSLKLPYFKEKFNDLTRGLAQSRIREKFFLDLEVALPKIEVQRLIVEKIKINNKKNQEFQSLNYSNLNLVSKLRQAILQQAVQGKLVPQDPKDEPASELLKKIKTERDRLIKEGEIKKGKELPPIEEDEVPYELPKGWEWVRLGEICQINPRNHLDDNLDVAFIPMNLIQDNAKNKFNQEIKKWHQIKTGFTHFAEEDVIFAKITPCFQNRNSAILRNLKNKFGAGTTELYVLRSYKKTILPEFLFLLVNSQDFIDQGIATYKGTAGQQRIKREFVESYLIGFPPLAEQKRIIEKVDKLINYCDEFEKQTKENQTNSEKLMDAFLKESFEK